MRCALRLWVEVNPHQVWTSSKLCLVQTSRTGALRWGLNRLPRGGDGRENFGLGWLGVKFLKFVTGTSEGRKILHICMKIKENKRNRAGHLVEVGVMFACGVLFASACFVMAAEGCVVAREG